MPERLYNYRRHLPHFQRPGVPLFVTFRKLSNIPFPGHIRAIVLEHCVFGHDRTYELFAAVVMPDHVHLLLTPLPDESGWPQSLNQILRGIKGTSAYRINKLVGTSGQVWQRESFDHVLRTDESMRQKIDYIRQNPVRKGLAAKPEEYEWLWVNPDWM